MFHLGQRGDGAPDDLAAIAREMRALASQDLLAGDAIGKDRDVVARRAAASPAGPPPTIRQSRGVSCPECRGSAIVPSPSMLLAKETRDRDSPPCDRFAWLGTLGSATGSRLRGNRRSRARKATVQSHRPALRFLVAESEPPEAREARRDSVGRSSGETYRDTLMRLAPDAECHSIKPADAGAGLPAGSSLASYDGIFLTGSPLHLYKETLETRRHVEFMRAVFASATPSFGSCAGLQVATVAAGGTVRRNARGREAGFARRITPTEAGRSHPLLAGRPSSYDAPAIHTDEVETLPDGAVLLAGNRVTAVQAAEIRFDGGVFWGVQYHPEIALDEIAGALRRQGEDLIDAALAASRAEVDAYADQVEALHREPRRRDLAWRLGLDEQVTDEAMRSTELRNFVDALVKTQKAVRLRG